MCAVVSHVSFPRSLPRSGGFATRPYLSHVTFPRSLPRIFPTFRRVCNPPASCCGFATRVIPFFFMLFAPHESVISYRFSLPRVTDPATVGGGLQTRRNVGAYVLALCGCFRVSLRETNVTSILSHVLSPIISHVLSHVPSHVQAGLQPACILLRVCNPRHPGFFMLFAQHECGTSYAFPFPGSQTRPQSAAGCKPAATWEPTC